MRPRANGEKAELPSPRHFGEHRRGGGFASPFMAVKNTPIEGEQRTFQARPGVIETVVKGRLTARVVEAAGAEVERLGAGPIWLLDGVAITGFDTDCVRAGSVLLLRLKKKGLKRVVGVIPSATLRMAARAASLASGIDVRLVERRLEVGPLLVLDR